MGRKPSGKLSFSDHPTQFKQFVTRVCELDVKKGAMGRLRMAAMPMADY
jgi:hypothetical protein